MIALVAGAIALVLLIARNMVRYDMNPVQAALIPLFYNTVWAPGFTEQTFSSVQIGADTNTVIALLGPPMNRDSYDENLLFWRVGTNTEVYSKRLGSPLIRNWWHYTSGRDGRSWSASSDSTHIRALRFDTNGVLVQKVYEFNYD